MTSEGRLLIPRGEMRYDAAHERYCVTIEIPAPQGAPDRGRFLAEVHQACEGVERLFLAAWEAAHGAVE